MRASIAQAGAKVVAIGDVSVNIYNPNGIDVEKAYEYANSHGRSLEGYSEPGMTTIGAQVIIWLNQLMYCTWQLLKTN